MYTDDRVARFVTENFVPVRVHVRNQAAGFQKLGERYGAQWTPTILELEADGSERHRIEGFLPVDDFLAQLTLGLARSAFKAGRWQEAEQRFRDVVDRHPKSDAAAEALYWAGVSRYKATGDGRALAETAAAFEQRYRDSTWAKKSVVWKA